MNNTDTGLRRRLNLPLLTLYGLGTTVGAGIYVLVGKVAGRAGEFAPVSFLAAAVLAGFTAWSYAELSSRFPKSAGEAVYVRQGLKREYLARLVGFLVIATGVVSSATLAQGFAGYFGQLVAVPDPLATVAVILVLALVAAWGIGESVMIASLLTVLEVFGLLMVVWAGRDVLSDGSSILDTLTPPLAVVPWAGILGGSFLAFFAFIGFEDIVNVAEEVRDERRTLPLAIGLTLALTMVLYFVVVVIAVRSMPLDALRQSGAPLVEIFEHQTGRPGTVLKLIGTFAVINGALIQIIMASRVLYGMASQGWMPRVLASVHRKTRTPLHATAVIATLILLLALLFDLELLAEVTTLIILGVFTLVNVALVQLKRRGPPPQGCLSIPFWAPVAGAVVSAVFMVLTFLDLMGRINA
ncbi:MAG: amino acid permease [Proteobacteria bacterium]|nr:amino acid permease [Pseudomonadota bacterium]MDA1022510.1 amino acid permease [Pseudomonadota bacterium]